MYSLLCLLSTRPSRQVLVRLLLFLIALPWLAQAQCPPLNGSGDIDLTSQAQVDAFPPTCTVIPRGLNIRGADITNLRSLSVIQTARGINISNNASLSSLEGLNNLTFVEFGVVIQSNVVLTNLQGLNRLQSAGGLDVRSNPSLSSLGGLEMITSVSASVLIQNNPALINLQGLNQLRSAGLFDLRSNTNLNSLSGLDKFTLLSSGSTLIIQNNTKLSQCAIESICALIGGTGRFFISSNAPGCNSVQDIQADCAPLAITSQPPSQSAVCVGSRVTAAVSTTGNARTYQWYKGNQPVSGQTTNTLSLSNVQPADAGSYVVVVSNSVSSLTSTAFTLTVNSPSTSGLTNSGNLSCVNPAVTLLATGGSSYELVRSVTNVNGYQIRQTEFSGTGFFSVRTPGEYSVTIRGSNGCATTLTTSVGGTECR